MRLAPGPTLALSLLLLATSGGGCSGGPVAAPDSGAPPAGADAALPDAAFDLVDAAAPPDATEPADAEPADAEAVIDAATADAAAAGEDAGVDAGPACGTGVAVEALAACLELGSGPDACLAAVTTPLCDSDADGVPDDLEGALARAYAPVFLFNGGAYGGNPENKFPANVDHFVSRSKLFFRPTGSSALLVDPAPSLSTLAAATVNYQAVTRVAADPAAGQGSDFWLCLNDHDGSTTVDSPAAMLALAGGIDVETVVHPANGALADSSHLFVAFVVFWAFNSHSTVDDHEGDREILAVFVNRQTGAVDAAQYERHLSMDNAMFVDVARYGAKDPALDVPTGDVNTPPAGARGVRFWDYSGLRHQVVAYVATGGHAFYDFPGNTFIVYLGPRDTHAGDGGRLQVGTGEFFESPTAPAQAVRVNLNNPGEPGRIGLDWARYRGQWGCQEGPVANSYPGPFGNARHPRPVFERTWGSPPRG
ncbi:MAG TPA: hypothetical protein VGK67_21130 [Myxococcales bacterium]|jgi:hypothetical protein